MSEPLAQNSIINHETIIETNKNENDRKRKGSNMTAQPTTKMLRSNYYALLDIENDTQCDKELLKQFERHVQECKNKTTNVNSEQSINKPTKNNQTTESNKNNNKTFINENNNNNLSTNKPKKIPPINIIDIDTKDLIEFIKNGLKIKEFQIKEFRDKKCLFLNSLEDFVRVKAYLEKTKANFFTFTPKGIKTKSILLKGLNADIDTQLIYEELCKHEDTDLKFLKISQFSTRKSIKENYSIPMFIVQVSADSNINKLKKIKTLLHLCITWEQLRRPEITQCRNCQGFFHSAANCFLPAKCVKCNKDHKRGKCTMEAVAAEDKDKLFCVLCNKFGHPASYRGCEIYKKLQQKLRDRRQKIVENKINKNNININQTSSYADVTKGNGTLQVENNNLNNTLPTTFMNELKAMIMNLTNQMVNLQKQLQLQTSRIDTIFSMIGV